MADAGPAATASVAASAGATSLLNMLQSRRRWRPLHARARLRIKRGDSQGIVPEVRAGHVAHLLGRDLAQLAQLQVQGAKGNTGGFQRSDLARLGQHRVALVNVLGYRLCLGALQLLLGHAVLDNLGHLAPQARLYFSRGLAGRRDRTEVEEPGAARDAVVAGVRRP